MQWSQSYLERGVQFIWINYRESVSTVQTFVNQHGITHPVLLDSSGSVYMQYQLNGNLSPFPLDYIVDQNGIIAYGATEYNPIAMRAELERLLANSEVKERSTDLPYTVHVQTYPNPFNHMLNLSISVNANSMGQFYIYNLEGKQMFASEPLYLHKGFNRRTWNGSSATSGVYFLVVKTPTFVTTKKILLLK